MERSFSLLLIDKSHGTLKKILYLNLSKAVSRFVIRFRKKVCDKFDRKKKFSIFTKASSSRQADYGIHEIIKYCPCTSLSIGTSQKLYRSYETINKNLFLAPRLYTLHSSLFHLFCQHFCNCSIS